MFRTFNMGVRIVLIVGDQHALTLYEKMGQKAWIIREMIDGEKK